MQPMRIMINLPQCNKISSNGNYSDSFKNVRLVYFGCGSNQDISFIVLLGTEG